MYLNIFTHSLCLQFKDYRKVGLSFEVKKISRKKKSTKTKTCLSLSATIFFQKIHLFFFFFFFFFFLFCFMTIMTEVLNPLNNTDVIVGPRYVKTRLWAYKQSNQDLYCLLTELLDIGNKIYWWRAKAWAKTRMILCTRLDAMRLRILRMFEGTF